MTLAQKEAAQQVTLQQADVLRYLLEHITKLKWNKLIS